MRSIDHTKNRAAKTRDAQASLATAPGWTWSKKTVVQWSSDITRLEQLLLDESVKLTQWRNAAELWQSEVDQIQSITRQFVSIGAVQLGISTATKALFARLRTDAKSRTDIYEQGVAARDTWQELNPAWQISPSITLGGFSSLLTGSLARKDIHGQKETAWRRAEAELTVAAEALDRDNLTWYIEATRRFPANTPEGAMIRTTVPTNSRPERSVGQAAITNLLVAGSTIHFDCAAPHATRYTYLQQPPNAGAFVVVVADTTEKSLTLTGQPPGLHRFKVIGRNSRGEGPPSTVAEATVAQAAAA